MISKKSFWYKDFLAKVFIVSGFLLGANLNNLLYFFLCIEIIYHHWLCIMCPLCISLAPCIWWLPASCFNDFVPQIALNAITTNEAVLRNWRTIGRWVLTLSRKEAIEGCERLFNVFLAHLSQASTVFNGRKLRLFNYAKRTNKLGHNKS